MTEPTGDRGVPDSPARLTAWVHGTVQGVGFRWWTRSRAGERGLAGSAKNLVDGRVEIVVEGPRSACEALLDDLRGPRTPGSIDTVIERWDDPRGATGFEVR